MSVRIALLALLSAWLPFAVAVAAAENLGREILLTVRVGSHTLSVLTDDKSIAEGDSVTVDIPLETAHFYREESVP